MITHIPASKRYHSVQGWLNTYHLFSFADYFDRDNLNFGTLRVFNDDTIDAFSGFGEHGHEDMEIVTLVHSGELSHRDSLGNNAKIKAGEVQRMSAGTGVMHAEKNLADEPVHLYQIWFMPENIGLKPSYEQKDFSYTLDKNKLNLVASDNPTGEALKLNARASIHLAELEDGAAIEYPIKKDHGIFIYIRKGNLKLGDLELHSGDQARIAHETQIKITASEAATFILIDVPLT